MRLPRTEKDLAGGLALLRRPLLPLARLVGFLYLTGPFERIEAILPELPDPVETNGLVYDNPAPLLRAYLPALREFEQIKTPAPRPYRIIDDKGAPLTAVEALELWMSHQLLTQELAEINSLLCGPCNCTLCCTGPTPEMAQDFFEIPLTEKELHDFILPRVDTEESRASTPHANPPFRPEKPAGHHTSPALYRWQTGWSLMLPRNSRCPHLKKDGRCGIYPDRPEVCRRPQIFSYAIEQQPLPDSSDNHQALPLYIAHRKLLGVWDCPYVQIMKEEIATFAARCELEPLFRKNKA